MKSGKSNGKDDKYIEFFKLVNSEELEEHVISIINDNLANGITPAGMRDAIIVFLFKKGDNTLCNNYRTLSLLSVIGKIQSRMILARLIEVAEKHGWLGETQQAFRRFRGGGDSVLIGNMVDSHLMEKNLPAYKLFVDNSKAYDFVVRDVLWIILERRGVPPLLLNLIKSTMIGARAVVKDNGVVGEETFDLTTGLKQGCVLSCLLFNLFMGAIMEEIRLRLRAAGIGIKIKYNFDCNPFVRVGESSKSNTRVGFETIVNDILFADDSVFYGYANEVEMNKVAAVVDEVMTAFGQKVNIKKTEFMIVQRPITMKAKSDSSAELLVVANLVAEAKARKATIVKIGDETLGCVEHFRYIGSMCSGDGSLHKEIQTRNGKMKFAYYVHRDNVFQNRRLDTIKKLQLYRIYVVPCGIYNCSAWVCSDDLLKTVNATARSLLMRIFGFKFYHRTSYDYLIKLCRCLGIDMFPIHLMVKASRLTFFGHIVRMKDDRLLKQLLFGEIADKKRPKGHPRLTWTDCVKKDLVDFGICEEGELNNENEHANWLKLKESILDREGWRVKVKSVGIEHALLEWYKSNTSRRASRMISEQRNLIQCEEPNSERRQNERDYARSLNTPLENVPDGSVPKLVRDLGLEQGTILLDEVKRVEDLVPRYMADYSPWCEPYIMSRMNYAAKDKTLRDIARSEQIRMQGVEKIDDAEDVMVEVIPKAEQIRMRKLERRKIGQTTCSLQLLGGEVVVGEANQDY
jgi:hypothetical protein